MLAVALKIKKDEATGLLSALNLLLYHYDPTITLNTRTTSHNKVSLINTWDVLTGPAEITIPAEILARTQGCPAVIYPQPSVIKVDLTAYVVAVREAIEL